MIRQLLYVKLIKQWNYQKRLLILRKSENKRMVFQL